MLRILKLSIIFILFLTFSAEANNSESEEKVINLITSEFSIIYENNYQEIKSKDLSVSGWQNNQLRASGQILFSTWLAKISVIGSRSKINLESFSYNPVFSFDYFQIEGGLGYKWKLSENSEFYGGINYLFSDYKPDNKNPASSKSIPYTNSYLDNNQTRQGPGLNALYYWKIIPNLSFTVDGYIYPYLFSSVKDIYLLNAKGTVNLRYTIAEGFLISGFYSKSLYFGTNIYEDNNTFGIGLSLVPERIKEE